MRTLILFSLVLCSVNVGGCARRDQPVASAAPVAHAPGAEDGEEGLTELPAMQADLIAKAGSDTVLFATDKSDLDASSQVTLSAQARWMMANPSVRASIEGHCDERGTREYNLALGERRANAARDFLVSLGVPVTRLLVTSWGKERPVAAGSSEEAWAQNRRAVTLVVR